MSRLWGILSGVSWFADAQSKITRDGSKIAWTGICSACESPSTPIVDATTSVVIVACDDGLTAFRTGCQTYDRNPGDPSWTAVLPNILVNRAGSTLLKPGGGVMFVAAGNVSSGTFLYSIRTSDGGSAAPPFMLPSPASSSPLLSATLTLLNSTQLLVGVTVGNATTLSLVPLDAVTGMPSSATAVFPLCTSDSDDPWYIIPHTPAPWDGAVGGPAAVLLTIAAAAMEETAPGLLTPGIAALSMSPSTVQGRANKSRNGAVHCSDIALWAVAAPAPFFRTTQWEDVVTAVLPLSIHSDSGGTSIVLLAVSPPSNSTSATSPTVIYSATLPSMSPAPPSPSVLLRMDQAPPTDSRGWLRTGIVPVSLEGGGGATRLLFASAFGDLAAADMFLGSAYGDNVTRAALSWWNIAQDFTAAAPPYVAMSGAPASSQVLTDGFTAVAGLSDGTVFAADVPSGTPMWAHQVPGRITGLATDADGHVYVSFAASSSAPPGGQAGIALLDGSCPTLRASVPYTSIAFLGVIVNVIVFMLTCWARAALAPAVLQRRAAVAQGGLHNISAGNIQESQVHSMLDTPADQLLAGWDGEEDAGAASPAWPWWKKWLGQGHMPAK